MLQMEKIYKFGWMLRFFLRNCFVKPFIELESLLSIMNYNKAFYSILTHAFYK